jgi:transposase-like protein
MNIIERGRAFLQSLRELAGRTAWDWKQCPQCGSTLTIKNGSYRRHPWFLSGRETVRVQRHLCHACTKSYSEQSALLVRGSWYAREVHRAAVDHWQHVGTSLRRTAEVLRSWLGRQERWRLWRPLDNESAEHCYLAASTVQRWLDGAGKRAQASVDGQLTGIANTQVVGTDGLWAKLKGKAQRVVLLIVDSLSWTDSPGCHGAGLSAQRRQR